MLCNRLRREGGRRGPSFSSRFTEPRASASADRSLSVSGEVTSSAGPGEGGQQGRAAIYLCKFTEEKIQPERKVSDGWAPHFWSPLSQHAAEGLISALPRRSSIWRYGWMAGRVQRCFRIERSVSSSESPARKASYIRDAVPISLLPEKASFSFKSFCRHSVRTLSRALQHLVAQCLTTIVVQCLHPCSFHAAPHF